MKKILPKRLKFISSRLTYLIIGILIAIAVGVVYATWDDARTGGSGQLSEANWNELVTMIENNIGGSPYINWGDCTYKGTCANTTITCDAGYTLVTHSCSQHYYTGSTYKPKCYLTGVNSLRIISLDDYNYACGSIKCCKYIVP